MIPPFLYGAILRSGICLNGAQQLSRHLMWRAIDFLRQIKWREKWKSWRDSVESLGKDT
jgi:hypothetical protein